jgi:small GTP-binding protein
MKDYTFKIMILGDSSVGKTTLANRYVTGVFTDVKMTVGVNFYVKRITFGKKRIRLQLWDMGGEKRFRFLLPTYCLGSAGALYVYDITRENTLDNIHEWIKIIKDHNGNIPIMLVGNKVDLEAHNRQVPRTKGIEVAKKMGCIGFVEISAKTGANVEDAFEAISNLMLKSIKNEDQEE